MFGFGLRRNWEEMRRLGPRFLWRHTQRLTGKETACVFIPNFGRVHLRLGESDVAAVMQTVADRQYEMKDPLRSRVHARYQEIINSGQAPIIVDAGANIGLASIWFANQYPLARIVAIEPEKGNFRVLEKNVGSNPNIIPVCAAIGSTPGFVSVRSKPGVSWGAETSRAEQGIPIVTMASAFGRTDGIPFIAKIDIEGFESDLFSSSTDWLQTVNIVLVEPHDWLFPGTRTSKSFQREMARHDFEIHILGENLVYVRL
jgi:FkbM family methyltransferase